VTISINQLSSGTALKINNDILIVTSHNHVKPGKGGAFVRAKLKNIKTNQVIEKTFKPADKLEEVNLEERKLQNLYRSGDEFHFMDLTSYEEVIIDKSIIGDDIKFLQENLEIIGVILNEKVLKINMPTFIIAEIIQTEPGFKGDSSKAGNKPATIDTEVTIQVPLFINIGDHIKIDTRSGEYVERVKV